MKNYTVFADSTCDIDEGTLSEWGIKRIPLTFTVEDEGKTFPDGEIPNDNFYEMMRAGKTMHTAALNPTVLRKYFTPALNEDKDILYVSFSSGLSSTFSVAKMTAAELETEYPGRKVLVADSLCESAGYGMLLYLLSPRIKADVPIEKLVEYIEKTKLQISHRFTVGDLKYLKRGGRISPAVALAGTMLGIKPMLHMDNEGHLVSIGKVRGRKASIHALVDAFTESKISDEPVFISHSGCMEDAEFLANELEKSCGIKVQYIAEIGAVIGSHCGPGTLAVFFLANKR